MIMNNNESNKKAILLDLSEKELAEGVARNLTPYLKQQFNDFISEFYEDKDTPISIDDAADYLGVSRSTFSKILNRGEIPFSSLNPDNPKSKKLILKSDLLGYMERHRTKSIQQIRDSYNGKA